MVAATPKVKRVDDNIAVMNLENVAASIPKVERVDKMVDRNLMERVDTMDVSNLEDVVSFDTDPGISDDLDETSDESNDNKKT